MSNAMPPIDPGGLIEQITCLLDGRKRVKLDGKPPSDLDDVQEQMMASFQFMQTAYAYKDSGDYWSAIAHFTENLKYYISVGDTGKFGHVLLEVVDCLFSAKEFSTAIEFCEYAITLLIRSRDRYDWARGIAAVGELLLATTVLSVSGVHETRIVLGRIRSGLTLKERRILFSQDAHRVVRKVVEACETKTLKPLEELVEMRLKRRRAAEAENLLVLFDEWKRHYKIIADFAEKSVLRKDESGKKNRKK